MFSKRISKLTEINIKTNILINKLRDRVDIRDIKNINIDKLEKSLDKDLNKIYDIISEFDNYLVYLENISNKIDVVGLSITYIGEINDIINDIKNLIGEYWVISEKEDIEIFESERKNIPDDINEYIVAHSGENINRYSIWLYSLSKNKKHTYIDQKIEEIKDNALGSSRILKKKYLGTQRFMIRYGLRPATQYAKIEKIFEIINKEYNNDKSDIQNIKNINGILIDRTSQSTIEYDIRALIDLDYILENELITKDKNGLNTKILSKYTTIKALERGDKKQQKIKYEKPDSKTTYVFETINQLDYRILSRNKKYEIDISYLTGIYDGFNSRANDYNSIMEDTIFKNAHSVDNKYILNSYQNRPKQKIDANNILIDKLIEKYMDDIDSKNIKNKHSLNKLITNRNSIYSVVCSTLYVDKYGHVESDLSIYLRLYNIAFDLSKEIEKRLSLYTFEIDFTSMSNINGIIIKIVKSAIEEIDKRGTWEEYTISLKEYYFDRKYL